MTRGQRALLQLLQDVPTRIVAATCRVSERAVRYWATGDKTPSPTRQRALERFRIPSAAWGVYLSTAPRKGRQSFRN